MYHVNFLVSTNILLHKKLTLGKLAEGDMEILWLSLQVFSKSKVTCALSLFGLL